MTTNIDDAFGGGGAKSAFGKVVQIGQTVGGPIVSAEIRQASVFDRDGKPTGELRNWDDGKPVLELMVITRTAERDPSDPDDDGRRSHRVKTYGAEKKRFVDAVQAAGYQKLSEALVPGNEFWQKLIALDPSTGIPRRDYEYRIVRGTAAGIDQAMGQRSQAPPAQQGYPPQGQPAYPQQRQQAPQGYPPPGQPVYPQQPVQYPPQGQPQQQPGSYPNPPQGGPGEPPF